MTKEQQRKHSTICRMAGNIASGLDLADVCLKDIDAFDEAAVKSVKLAMWIYDEAAFAIERETEAVKEETDERLQELMSAGRRLRDERARLQQNLSQIRAALGCSGASQEKTLQKIEELCLEPRWPWKAFIGVRGKRNLDF